MYGRQGYDSYNVIGNSTIEIKIFTVNWIPNHLRGTYLNLYKLY